MERGRAGGRHWAGEGWGEGRGRAGVGHGEGRGRVGGRLAGEGGRHAIHLKTNPHVIKSTLIYHKAGGSLAFQRAA